MTYVAYVNVIEDMPDSIMNKNIFYFLWFESTVHS